MSHLNLQYPELDLRLYSGPSEVLKLGWFSSEVATHIDVLEIGQAEHLGLTVFWEEGMDHDRLVGHLQHSPRPTLRILFVSTASDARTRNDEMGRLPAMSQRTAEYLVQELGVSPQFLTSEVILKNGNACFSKRTTSGTQTSGFYRLSCCSLDIFSAMVWFAHNPTVNGPATSLHVVRNCAPNIKSNILRAAQAGFAHTLLRPMAVDAFIADRAISVLSSDILKLRDRLVEQEIANFTQFKTDVNGAIERLHRLSQTFHTLHEDLADLSDCLEYLLAVHCKVLSRATCSEEEVRESPTSTSDSLLHLLSKVNIWRRWTRNYIDRVSIRINLLFNLSSQWDNQTNLHVAEFTSRIATVTQRDSSSMTTMAAVTMLFLPGAFISSIFSTVFFNTYIDTKGTFHVAMSPQWWLFLVITAPLTLLVFALWNYLRKQHFESIFPCQETRPSTKEEHKPATSDFNL